MSTIGAGSKAIPASRTTSNLGAKLIASAVMLIVAVSFFLKYVFRYYMHYITTRRLSPIRCLGLSRCSSPARWGPRHHEWLGMLGASVTFH